MLRFGGEIVLDVVLASTALFSAFLIRFEADRIVDWLPLFVQATPIVVPLQLVGLVVFGTYRTLWRYVSTTDVTTIVGGIAAGTITASAVILYVLHWTAQSRAVFLMDALILAAFVAGSRFFLVWLRDSLRLRPRAGARRVLIVGANETGRLALQLLLRSTEASYRAAGFVDDDPGKIGRRIAGVPIFGPVSALEAFIQREQADLVVIATDVPPADRASLRHQIETAGVETREFAKGF
jgi:FlaA1/EpsC-like NDP-sugar epimerase